MDRKGGYLDAAVETRNWEEHVAGLEARLRKLVGHAYANAPAVKAKFDAAGIGPGDVGTLADLARVPVTGKMELVDLQKKSTLVGFLCRNFKNLSCFVHFKESIPSQILSRFSKREDEKSFLVLVFYYYSFYRITSLESLGCFHAILTFSTHDDPHHGSTTKINKDLVVDNVDNCSFH